MPTLRTYHIKTLMLWACELKPKSWWNELTVVEICVYLLKVLAVWLQDGRCKHYFICNCNLLDPNHVDDVTAIKLKSLKEVSLAKWFNDNYILTCYPVNVLSYDNFVESPQDAISAVADWRSDNSLKLSYSNFLMAHHQMMLFVSRSCCLSVRMCLYVISETSKTDHRLLIYFAAVQFLRVALETARGSLKEEQLRMLRVLCYHVIRTLPTDEILECFYELLQTFASMEIHVTGIRCMESFRYDRLLRLLRYQARPAIVCQLETSELVELLQQYAVEYLTIFRQIEVRDFGSVMSVGSTVVYNALYAYKLGNYRHCLQLCTEHLHELFCRDFEDMALFITCDVLIQLLDDDIVSLTGIIIVAVLSYSYVDNSIKFNITQRCLLLHLMAQCHMKLHHSKTSLIKILMLLKCAEVASHTHVRKLMILDQLTLKLTKKKILHYMRSVDTQTTSESDMNSAITQSHFARVLAYILFYFLYFIVADLAEFLLDTSPAE